MIVPIRYPYEATRTFSWHHRFLAMLPGIRRQARMAFSALPAEERSEAIQEATVNALIAYLGLLKRGKEELAYATPLARYAVAQLRSGRTTGSSLNSKDMLSPYAQRKRGFVVRRLSELEADSDSWREALIEDKRSTPADVAASRIDFAAWLARLPSACRHIAMTLAMGETTRETAQQFSVSPGRISQLRAELEWSWICFQSETSVGAVQGARLAGRQKTPCTVVFQKRAGIFLCGRLINALAVLTTQLTSSGRQAAA